MKMKLYENITIGNFLFALGYSLHETRDDSLCSSTQAAEIPAQ